MTHDISMHITLNTWTDVLALRSLVLNDCSGMNLFNVRGDGLKLCAPRQTCPFVWMPEDEADKEPDGKYFVSVSTGSHCGWEDTNEILYVWTFWYMLKEKLEGNCFNFEYYIVNTNDQSEHLTLTEAFNQIRDHNTDFAEITNLKRKK